MLHDISPHQYTFAEETPLPRPEDFMLCYQEECVFMRCDQQGLHFPRFSELDPAPAAPVYLFSIDGQHFFLNQDEQLILPEAYTAIALRPRGRLHSAKPRWLPFAAVTGMHLNRWYQNRRFCGHCSTKTIPHHRDRALTCPNCGLTEYPKISPAVIVAIMDNDRLLLSRYANRPYKRYALIAGFNEAGESIEQTVRREVMEEVGLQVKNIRFYKSQPWGFTDSLLMGFYCQLDGDDTIVLNTDELEEALWFERSNLPLVDDNLPTVSLTQEMIALFKRDEYNSLQS